MIRCCKDIDMFISPYNTFVSVAHHLPDIFHIVTLLVSSGPVSLRASIHGLVINSLQSLLACSKINLTGMKKEARIYI